MAERPWPAWASGGHVRDLRLEFAALGRVCELCSESFYACCGKRLLINSILLQVTAANTTATTGRDVSLPEPFAPRDGSRAMVGVACSRALALECRWTKHCLRAPSAVLLRLPTHMHCTQVTGTSGTH